MWAYFKYREILYNIRQGPVLFNLPARSTIYVTNFVQFRRFLMWKRQPIPVKSGRTVSEL